MSPANPTSIPRDIHLSAREIYEITGDVSQALQCLSDPSQFAEEYNAKLLDAISSSETTQVWKDLEALEQEFMSRESESHKAAAKSQTFTNHNKWKRQQNREECVVTYNRGLLLLGQGEPQKAINLVWKILEPIYSEDDTKKLPQNLQMMICRMGLLIVEAVLNLSVGHPRGIAEEWPVMREDRSNNSTIPFQSFLKWITKAVDQLPTDSSNGATTTQQYQEHHSLKFALSLYIARLEFMTRENDRMSDASIKSARKELKQAMEIMSNKLKPNADNSSIASGSGTGGVTSPAVTATGMPPSQDLFFSNGNNNNTNNNIVLNRQTQAALNLKAHTEQLKGNMKKALILCHEAQSTTTNTSSGSRSNDTRWHANNLAMIYASSGKPHLALHAWRKAIQSVDLSSKLPASPVESDGTLRLSYNCQILWNAALGSLQARNFIAAYECLGACLQTSDVWRQRPRAWLRLGEACIGIHHEKMTSTGKGVGKSMETSEFSYLKDAQGELMGIVLDYQRKLPDIGSLASVLSSEEDMAQIQMNSLPRARCALECALELLKPTNVDGEKRNEDDMVLISTWVSLSYVCLEMSDFESALNHAKLALAESQDLEASSPAQATLVQRQQATARLYAAEAACRLGDATLSMKYLVGDGKADAFDRLASQLGGVTMEVAGRFAQGKRRLAKAQAMVRCSASAASACMGNISAAKQLAMSAQAMSREGFYATRALVYCLLREGNRGAALTLLRSTR